MSFPFAKTGCSITTIKRILCMKTCIEQGAHTKLLWVLVILSFLLWIGTWRAQKKWHMCLYKYLLYFARRCAKNTQKNVRYALRGLQERLSYSRPQSPSQNYHLARARWWLSDLDFGLWHEAFNSLTLLNLDSAQQTPARLEFPGCEDHRVWSIPENGNGKFQEKWKVEITK